MRIIISLVICCLLLNSCAVKKQKISQPAETYFEHTVSIQGETLGAIANWYTGSSANWSVIANANPGLQVKNIRLGQTIRIPQRLVRRKDPIAADFINKVNAAPETNTKSSVVAHASSESINESKSDATQNEVQPAAENKAASIVDQLFMAVTFGDVAQLNTLLSSGADANARYNDRSMLGWAAQNPSLETVQILIKAKADLNVKDGVGHTPLMRAVDTGQTQIVQALIDAGADLSAKTNEGKTVVHIAVDNSNLEILRALIKAGADLNATTNDGYSPALLAAQNSNLEIIALLGENKANFNLSNIIYTPLSYAISQGNKQLVEAIIKAGADPNAKPTQGNPPLLQAMDEPEIFNLLLTAKANPNVTNSYGETALMLAVQNNNVDKIEPLLKAGANPNLKTENGSTALSMAQNSMLNDIVELLKKNGATE